MASESRTGALLAVLAASKPRGRLLEIGTGTGVGTSWLLSGMSAHARLDTVDDDEKVVAVAMRHLGSDARVTFHAMDGVQFMVRAPRGAYDLVYADAWPGKFFHLDEALELLAPGGVYVIDDLLPQPNGPEGHDVRVAALLNELDRLPRVITAKMCWSSGLMLLVRS